MTITEAQPCTPDQIEIGFDNDTYLEAQLTAFNNRILEMPGAQLLVEFGGKPFGDHHAARVLPGYDPDNKAKIINNLQQDHNYKIAMVINARDILFPPDGRTLNGRIRGDSGLRYEDDVIRLMVEAEEDHGFAVEDLVLAVTPHEATSGSSSHIGRFVDKVVTATGREPKRCYQVPGYPDTTCLAGNKLDQAFAQNDVISEPGRNLLLMSPGGGSGKFGVILSEMYKKLASGEPVAFAKFETFPIFNLSPTHPLNLAFIAATADLDNHLVGIGNNKTNYDKDCENFALLFELAHRLPDASGYIRRMESQLDFSVNVIEEGITNNAVAEIAGWREVVRRLERYRREYAAGDEKLSTVQTAARVAGTCALHMVLEDVQRQRSALAA
jgi:uncharacterized protein (UPF0371 family)